MKMYTHILKSGIIREMGCFRKRCLTLWMWILKYIFLLWTVIISSYVQAQGNHNTAVSSLQVLLQFLYLIFCFSTIFIIGVKGYFDNVTP